MSDQSAPAEESKPSWITLGLDAVGRVLVVLAVLGAVANFANSVTLLTHWAHHPLYPQYQYGITLHGRDAKIALLCFTAVITPLVCTALFLDWFGSGVRLRSRLVMVGYLGSLASLLAFLASAVRP